MECDVGLLTDLRRAASAAAKAADKIQEIEAELRAAAWMRQIVNCDYPTMGERSCRDGRSCPTPGACARSDACYRYDTMEPIND